MADYQIVSSASVKESFDEVAATYGGIFFNHAILNAAGAGVEQLAIVQNDGRCVGGFNIQVIKLKGFKTIASPLFHPHCGLFIVPLEGGASTILSRTKKIFTAISAYLSARSEPIISIAFPPKATDMQPFIWDGFRSSVRYTYQLNLKEQQNLIEAYSSKTRNSIKKAEKLGVSINQTPSNSEVIEMLNSNAKEQGFTYHQTALAELVEQSSSGNGLAFSAMLEGRTIATAVTIADDQVAYYLFGGVDRKLNVQGALGFVLHELMCAHQKAERLTFDFEGSMIPAVENFFRGFGGQQVPYYMITKAPFWLAPLLRLKGKNEF